MLNDWPDDTSLNPAKTTVVIARTAQRKAKLKLDIGPQLGVLPSHMQVVDKSSGGMCTEAACWALPRLAKTFTLERGELRMLAQYNAGTVFWFEEYSFDDLLGLMRLLVSKASDPLRQQAIVAGGLTEAVKANPHSRHQRLSDLRKHGSQKVTLQDRLTRLFIIDLDGAQVVNWDPEYPEAGVQEICQRLGAPFEHADVLAHLTASQQPKKGTPARLRLYFLLNQPWTLKDQKRLLKELSQEHPSLKIDTSMATVGQPIYIAPPLIVSEVTAASIWNPAAVTVEDPISERWHLYRRGGDLVLEKPILQTVCVRWTRETSEGGSRVTAHEHTVKLREPGCELDGLDEFGAEVHSKILDATYNLALGHADGPQTQAVVQQVASALRLRALEGGPLAHRLDRLNSAGLEAEIERAYLGAWARLFGRRVEKTAAEKLDAHNGTLELEQALRRFLEGVDRRSLIMASMGLGKTTQLIVLMIASGHRVDLYVPDLALAEELKRKINALGGRAIVIRGRTADNPAHLHGGETNNCQPAMCRKAAAIERLQEMGAGPLGADQLCHRYDPGARRHEYCEHFRDCAYIRQHTEAPADTQFVIRAHDYLALEPGFIDRELHRRIGQPVFHVIDEDPVTRLITQQTFPLDRLELEYRDQRGWLPVIVQALRTGGNPVAAFIEHLSGCDSPAADDDDTWSRAQEAIDELIEECPNYGVTGVRPSMSTEEVLHRLQRGVRIDHWPGVLQAIQEAVMRRQCFTNAISVDRRVGIQQVQLDRLRTPVRVINSRKRLLILDGSADLIALNRVFGPLFMHDIQVQRNARIMQVRDRSFSDTQIKAENWRQDDVVGLVKLLQTTDQPGVITRKSLAAHFIELGVPTLHHGNLRGKDILKHADPIVVIGRMQPPPCAAEAQARAIYPFDNMKLTGSYQRDKAVYRVSSTEVQEIEEQNFTHPDPRVNARLSQIRDYEQLQAIDRGRLIHCDIQKTVLILSNQPISSDLEVELISLHDLLGPEGLMALLAAAGGWLPLNYHALMAFDPVRFPHEVRSKDFARRVVKWAQKKRLSVVRLVEDRQVGARGRHGFAVQWVGLHDSPATISEKEGCPINSI